MLHKIYDYCKTHSCTKDNPILQKRINDTCIHTNVYAESFTAYAEKTKFHLSRSLWIYLASSILVTRFIQTGRVQRHHFRKAPYQSDHGMSVMVSPGTDILVHLHCILVLLTCLLPFFLYV